MRLFQGKFDEVTEYSGDPLVVAQNWQQKGAQWLHIVDLDGAKTGEMQNRAAIIAIAKKFPSPSRSAAGSAAARMSSGSSTAVWPASFGNEGYQ